MPTWDPDGIENPGISWQTCPPPVFPFYFYFLVPFFFIIIIIFLRFDIDNQLNQTPSCCFLNLIQVVKYKSNYIVHLYYLDIICKIYMWIS